MFEDFRKQIDDASFKDEDEQEEPQLERTHQEHHFIGITPPQRFIVAILLLMMTFILGVLFLLVTAKIVPPFLG